MHSDLTTHLILSDWSRIKFLLKSIFLETKEFEKTENHIKRIMPPGGLRLIFFNFIKSNLKSFDILILTVSNENNKVDYRALYIPNYHTGINLYDILKNNFTDLMEIKQQLYDCAIREAFNLNLTLLPQINYSVSADRSNTLHISIDFKKAEAHFIDQMTYEHGASEWELVKEEESNIVNSKLQKLSMLSRKEEEEIFIAETLDSFLINVEKHLNLESENILLDIKKKLEKKQEITHFLYNNDLEVFNLGFGVFNINNELINTRYFVTIQVPTCVILKNQKNL